MDDKRQEDGSFIWYITIIGALGVLNLGYDFGISTTVGPELLKQDQFEVTSRGVELFNGLGAVGALFGALVSNFFADRFGRKTTLIISEVVFLIGLTGAVASQNLPSLLVNRIISGFGLGMIVPTSAVYLSELVSPKRRGRMVSWVEMFSQIGTTIAYIIGSLLSSLSSSVGWRVMLALAAIIPIAMLFFLLTFMPESPRWLIAHDQEAQAIEILREITKDDESKGFADAESLAKEIKEGIQSEKKMHDSSWEALFFPTPSVQQAMLVGFGLAAIQQLALPTAITMYMLFIMERDGIASSDVFIYLVLIGVVRIITVYFASRLIDMSSVGRRPLMLGSGGATALLLLLFAILFSVPTSSATTSMLVATMFFYAIAYQIGYGPGLYVILVRQSLKRFTHFHFITLHRIASHCVYKPMTHRIHRTNSNRNHRRRYFRCGYVRKRCRWQRRSSASSRALRFSFS